MNLKDVLSKTQIGRKEKVLIVLHAEEQSVKTVSQIRDILINSGVRVAKNWNLSQILGGTKGLAVRVKDGWEITVTGRQHLTGLGIGNVSPTAGTMSVLRAQASNIQNGTIQAFVGEAISALEHQLFRAAVVLSWVGALALLYNHVLQNHLAAFNQEAKKRDSKWKEAKSIDGLALMREHDFLQILPAISVIGKNVKQELEDCLRLRNGCGHPNSLSIADHRVASHLEVLILNVYSQFAA